jgi:hypothetical protein
VFPAGRKLPHLRSFEAFGLEEVDGGFHRMHCADVTRIVSCCPSLRQLGFHSLLANDMRIGPQTLLQPLTGLTKLELRCMEPPGLCNFSALTQLQSLRLFVELSFMLGEAAYSLQHLVHLTALTGLTELTSGVAEQDFAQEWKFAFRNRVSIAVVGGQCCQRAAVACGWPDLSSHVKVSVQVWQQPGS